MMKKFFSLLLSLSLLASGLAIPVAAAKADPSADPSADRRLQTVALAVKTTLGLDTTAYDAFYGDFNENILAPTWTLSWSGAPGTLNVTASEDGKILSYQRSDTVENVPTSGFLPSFPEGSRDDALAAAKTFLAAVLDGATETVTFTDGDAKTLSATEYRFSANILLHGVPSPFSLRITVRGADNQVLRFNRDDLSARYFGGIPSKTPVTTVAQASALLKSTLALKLEYALSDDGKTALLQYLPQSQSDYFVDAQTGKLVNLSELYAKLAGLETAGNLSVDSAPSPADGMRKEADLTEAELVGVAKLEHVMTKEALDAAVQKSFPELGLKRYTLAGGDYAVARADAEGEQGVTCTLTYSKKTNDGIFRRTVNVNAETAALKSVFSSAPWSEKMKTTVSQAKAQKNTEAFLKAHYPAEFAKTACYFQSDSEGEKYNTAHSFTYAQKENDIFFPANSFSLSIDTTDGSVAGFQPDFTHDVTFETTADILTEDQALDAYLATYTVPLAYVSVPTSVDYAAENIRPLLKEAGYRYLYTLSLGYQLERADRLIAISAKTGDPILDTWNQEEPAITYDDLAGHWAQNQVETLAEYQVGLPGASFRPDATLTQLDLVALLASTNGYRYHPEDEKAADSLYETAYAMGLLKKAERSDTSPVTRAALVKLILDGAGYGKVAALPGIFRCNYSDEASIPAIDYGYAALAQGLGLVKGDGQGAFAATRVATRGEAAVMLYQFLTL